MCILCIFVRQRGKNENETEEARDTREDANENIIRKLFFKDIAKCSHGHEMIADRVRLRFNSCPLVEKVDNDYYSCDGGIKVQCNQCSAWINGWPAVMEHSCCVQKVMSLMPVKK